MNDNKELLGTAPIGKLLFKLALPTVVAQLITWKEDLPKASTEEYAY